jgi:hypothetical protein
MCPTDDFPNETPSSQTEKRREGNAHRSIGPESEDRGGPEAVDQTLDDGNGQTGSGDDRRKH